MKSFKRYTAKLAAFASLTFATALSHASGVTSDLVEDSAWTKIQGIFTGPVAAIVLFLSVVSFFVGLAFNQSNFGKAAMAIASVIGLMSVTKLVSGIFGFSLPL